MVYNLKVINQYEFAFSLAKYKLLFHFLCRFGLWPSSHICLLTLMRSVYLRHNSFVFNFGTADGK